MKKTVALLLCAVLLMMPLCGCKKGENGEKYLTQKKLSTVSQDLSPTTLTFTDVAAKAGDQFEVNLSASAPSYLFGFSWEISYDSSVMTPVDIVASKQLENDFNVVSNKAENPLTLQGDGKEIQNYKLEGDIATFTFRLEADAAPGNYPIEIRCKDNDAGNNINVDAFEIPFTPVTATVTVKAE